MAGLRPGRVGRPGPAAEAGAGVRVGLRPPPPARSRGRCLRAPLGGGQGCPGTGFAAGGPLGVSGPPRTVPACSTRAAPGPGCSERSRGPRSGAGARSLTGCPRRRGTPPPEKGPRTANHRVVDGSEVLCGVCARPPLRRSPAQVRSALPGRRDARSPQPTSERLGPQLRNIRGDDRSRPRSRTARVLGLAGASACGELIPLLPVLPADGPAGRRQELGHLSRCASSCLLPEQWHSVAPLLCAGLDGFRGYR
ncbi:collagen alpha-1(I) chain-like [Mustela erminea]|uniref:collagen alpha-1(I) chain-like n=1 Tax=Mustela erminea TaxID=36723 RepID=UPI00138730FB|nr:collagen alpha-1(I) chain-like [Mustela erminea]